MSHRKGGQTSCRNRSFLIYLLALMQGKTEVAVADVWIERCKIMDGELEKWTE